MEKSDKTLIVVINWNRHVETCECIQSILCMGRNNVQIVLIDNGSKPDVIEYIIEWLDSSKVKYKVNNVDELNKLAEPDSYRDLSVVMFLTNNNLGFAGGVNIGFKYAHLIRPSYIWLLNNDTIVKDDSLSKLFVPQLSMGKDVIVGSCSLTQDNLIHSAGIKSRVFGISFRHLHRGEQYNSFECEAESYRVDFVSACSLILSYESLSKIGMMDEDYFMYHEDIDWQHYAKKIGFEILCSPNSIVTHYCGKSSANIPNFTLYYLTRNKLRLIRKNYKYRNPLLILQLLSNLFNILSDGLDGKFSSVCVRISAIVDDFKGKYGKTYT